MRASIALTLCAFSLLIGCGGPAGSAASNSKLIGIWLTQDTTSSTPNIAVQFSPDGKMECDIRSQVMLMGGQFVITGTWREAGDTLYTTNNDMRIDGLKFGEEKDKQKILEVAKSKLGMGVEKAATIKWLNDTQFTMTQGSDVSTYTKRPGS